MILEWVETLGSIFISWPVVGLIAIVIFRRPLRALANRFSGDDVYQFKVAGFEINRVKDEVKQTKSQIERLYVLSMSDDAFCQLKKLSSGSFGPFWLDQFDLDLRVGLAPELNYLKILGYIKFDRDEKVVDVHQLPKGNRPDDDLSDYISVTAQGREFISLREQALKTPNQARQPTAAP